MALGIKIPKALIRKTALVFSGFEEFPQFQSFEQLANGRKVLEFLILNSQLNIQKTPVNC
jgi:hypothetical protein